MNEQMADAIVAWWSRHMKDGPRDHEAVGRIGLDNPAAAMIINQTRFKMPKPQPEKVAAFEAALKKLLLEGPENTYLYGVGRWPDHFDLIVDYNAQGILLQATQKASLGEFCGLPWKTTMRIDGDTATVVSGDDRGQVVYPPPAV